ncbi:Dabb family protein, partial [Mesorhizobium sp. M1D.F.Ca.ET.183.01.1.1]|uniref:Dabb family protein n=1 Tax=Mesorhizobium sp. M1D.F.Ca.ET.183.01.1.1 TaxID=2496666 RepID=UPI001251BE80
MIRHIVFFSARRKEDVEAVRSGLQELGKIPHSKLFEVTLNTKVDQFSNAIDVVVY